jgi:transposase InsO family protein
MNVYPFVEAEQAEQRNVAKACALLQVSRTAYYQWSQHQPSPRAREDEALGQQIERIHHDSSGTYGRPRILARLQRDGVCVGPRRVARLMRQRGLDGRCKRRFRRTTIPDPQAGTVAVDLLQRHFDVAALELNQVWCGDITYIRTWEGWLYLATVIDLASRRVIGWAMAEQMHTTLVSDALRMAVESRRPSPGLIMHTDRGSQYTSRAFTALLAGQGFRQSLSRPRQCWDNAVAESWFATLKRELIYRRTWTTRAEARRAIFSFIELFYNRRRLHSALGYLSPVEYETGKVDQAMTAQAA